MNCLQRQVMNAFKMKTLGSFSYSSYDSHLSLKRLYPGSIVKPFTPKFQDAKSNANTFSGFIPLEQLQITYSRSGGPGGQNVNMVNTKVDVRFHVQSATWITEDIKKKLLVEHKTKVSKDGFFIIRSEKTRSQQLNLADALERIRALMWKLSEPEPTLSPETEERIWRQKEKAARIRLSEKRKNSQTKEDRKAPAIEL